MQQELPEQWNNTKKIGITVKQQVAPLQANEVANIRKKSANFDVRQFEFRENFRSIKPFRYSCENAYEHLDKVSIYTAGLAKFSKKWLPYGQVTLEFWLPSTVAHLPT